jgi:hypothetical protein
MVFRLGFCALMNLLVGGFVAHGLWVMLISFTGVAQTKLVRRASIFVCFDRVRPGYSEGMSMTTKKGAFGTRLRAE